MFRKRKQQHFPPGTFIPTKARVASIIQLCVAFSYVLWVLSQPFLNDLFAVRSEMALFETVFGTRVAGSETEREVLKRYHMQFAKLPQAQKEPLERHYQKLQEKNSSSLNSKLRRMLSLTLDAHPFTIALLLFSMTLPILLLRRREGAPQACCLLPVFAALAAYSNPPLRYDIKEAALFPTEQVLFEKYLKEAPKSAINDQLEQLQTAWNRYLIEEWSQTLERVQEDDSHSLLEQGEFAFTLARAQQKAGQHISLPSENKARLPWLPLYILWSLVFAWSAQYSKIGGHSHTSTPLRLLPKI